MTEAAPKDAVIRFLFERGFGWKSYLIERFGFPVDGWSHVRPLLDDGSSIDSYESTIHAPMGGWDVPGFPRTIKAGVAHRPPTWRKVKASALVVIPVTADKKASWLKFLWHGVASHIAYDMGAIEDFIEGVDAVHRNADICSAWARESARSIWLGHPSSVKSRHCSPDMVFALSQEAWGGTVTDQKGTQPKGAYAPT
jgi:hypothetical protein